MGINHGNTFKISDLKLASAIALNFPILKLDRTGSSKINFIFTDSPELQNAIASYWNRDLLVPALDYANQIDALKTQIYEELGR